MSTVQAPERGQAFVTAGAAAVAAAPAGTPSSWPHQEERPDHLRVVRPGERVRRNLTPVVGVLASAALFSLLLAVAVSHTVLVQGQVKLDQLATQLSEEQLQYQVLREDVAELESPTRVVEAARENGMVTPDDLVYLQPSSSDAATAGPTAGDASEPAVDPAVHSAVDRAWTDIKPMLESPSP